MVETRESKLEKKKALTEIRFAKSERQLHLENLTSVFNEVLKLKLKIISDYSTTKGLEGRVPVILLDTEIDSMHLFNQRVVQRLNAFVMMLDVDEKCTYVIKEVDDSLHGKQSYGYETNFDVVLGKVLRALNMRQEEFRKETYVKGMPPERR